MSINATTEEIKAELSKREAAEKSLEKIKDLLTQQTIDLLAPEHEGESFDDEFICSDDKIVNGINCEYRDGGKPDCVRCALLEVSQGKALLSEVCNEDTGLKLRLVFIDGE